MTAPRTPFRTPDEQWEWDGARWMPAATATPVVKPPQGARHTPSPRRSPSPNPWTAHLQIVVTVVLGLSGLYASITDLIGPSHQMIQTLALDGASGGNGLAGLAEAGFPLIALGGFMAALSACWAALLISGAIARWRWVYMTVSSSALAGGGLLTVFGLQGSADLLPLGQLTAASFAPVYLLLGIVCVNIALGVCMIVSRRHLQRSWAASR